MIEKAKTARAFLSRLFTRVSVAAMLAMSLVVSAFAEEPTITVATPADAMTALQSGLSTAQGWIIRGIVIALTAALVVFGIMLAVRMGLKAFKTAGGSRT